MGDVMTKPTKAMVRVKTRIVGRVKHSKSLIERMGMSVEQYERVALNMLVRKPELAKCTPESVDIAILDCIESGLVPDGREAAVLPFGTEAVLVRMIDGKLRKVREAIKGFSYRARVVYKDDLFEHEEGLDAKLVHKPNPSADHSPDKIVAAYAIGRDPRAAEAEWEVLYRGDLDRARKRSPAVRKGKRSPWDTDLGEMCEKTCGNLVLKRFPWRGDSAQAEPASHEGAAVLGYDAETGEVQDEPPPEEPEQRGEVVVVEEPPAEEPPPVPLEEPEPPDVQDAPPPEPEPPPRPRAKKQTRRAAPRPAPAPEPDEFGSSPF